MVAGAAGDPPGAHRLGCRTSGGGHGHHLAGPSGRAREGLYRAIADLVIDVDDLPPDSVADRIIGWLGPSA